MECGAKTTLFPNLTGVKGRPRFPSAFVVLLFDPQLRFDVPEIGGRGPMFAEVADGLKSVVDSPRLFLRAIKFVADGVIVRRDTKLTFQFG